MMTVIGIRATLMRLVESDLERFLVSKLQENDELEPSLLAMAETNQPALLETFYEWIAKENS
jgi:hypothetical protein